MPLCHFFPVVIDLSRHLIIMSPESSVVWDTDISTAFLFHDTNVFRAAAPSTPLLLDMHHLVCLMFLSGQYMPQSEHISLVLGLVAMCLHHPYENPRDRSASPTAQAVVFLFAHL